jgi:hypothetical protein
MIAAMGAATAQAFSFCPSGNLCLVEPNGQEVLIRAGGSASFNPPLPVDEINNQTTVAYCLEVQFSDGSILLTGIGAGQDETNLSESVISVSPGPVCPG